MEVPKVGRGHGRGRRLETIRPFFGRGRGRGRAGFLAQEVEDGTSSEEEVPKRMGRGCGRGRPKQLGSVGSPIESGRDIGIRAMKWDPFTLLPKEIYLIIFNKLADPNDKQRFMNAHTKWYKLFKDDRSLFLFGNVLETLAKHGNGIDRVVQEQDLWGYYLYNVTRDLNGLSDSDYLKLRLVCRDWDVAIQNYVQLHPSNFRIGGEVWPMDSQIQNGYQEHHTFVPIFETDWILRKQFGWLEAHALEAKLEIMKMTHPPSKNPFLTRNIRLNIDCLDNEEERNWRGQALNLLETYGRHVWHCQVIFAPATPETFSHFVKWLSLMPELKTLELCADLRIRERHRDWQLANNYHPEVEVPEMTKLSVVKCYQFEAIYFNKLVVEMKGVEKVIIGDNPKGFNHLYSDFLGGYLSLREFQIPADVKEASLQVIHELDIDYLKQTHLPCLRKLKLQANFKDESLKMWERILKVVEETFPHLEELNLEIPRVPIGKDRKVHEKTLNCRLNMPKLKKLRVVLPNLASLDFLFPLKELEELQIVLEYFIWDPDEPKELGEKEIIDFNKMDLDNMWESNIWEVLPKLRKLHIKAVEKPSENGYCVCSACLCFPFSFVRAPDPYKGVSEWHLYGYVKEGMKRKSMIYGPLGRIVNWKGIYKLFYTSQSYM